MNKALKTIAWICLVLGLLGIALDAGALIVSRRILSERQVSIQAMRDNLAEDKIPSRGNFCMAEDANQDGKPDGDCLQIRQPGGLNTRQSGVGRSDGLKSRFDGGQYGFHNNRIGAYAFLLLVFFALGPVLSVVGAVILLVNRQPAVSVDSTPKKVKRDSKDKK